jgi:hypothetical protein
VVAREAIRSRMPARKASTDCTPRSPCLRRRADRDVAAFGFATADGEHVGNLLKLGVADLGVHLIVAVVEGDADAIGGELNRATWRA